MASLSGRVALERRRRKPSQGAREMPAHLPPAATARDTLLALLDQQRPLVRPAHFPRAATERGTLLAFRAQQRLLARAAALGLTGDGPRLAPSASALSVGGIVKRLAQVGRSWMHVVQQPT